jgi:hypothetical protein
MKRKFTYDDLDLLQTYDIGNYDDWELEAELIILPPNDGDRSFGRQDSRFAHFGLGFFLGREPGYVFWCPSMQAARRMLGSEETVELDAWEFPHPPINIIGAPREFLTPLMMEKVEQQEGGLSHTWGTGGPRRGVWCLRPLRRNAAGELVAGPDYTWSWRKDVEKSPLIFVARIGAGGMRAEDLGLWHGPGNPATLRVREIDGVQTVYPRTEEYFDQFRCVCGVKVEDDLVVAVGKRLLRWGAWEDPVLLELAGPEEFGFDSDGGLLWWGADGEDMAEAGEVECLLSAMAASLAKCGVSLAVETVSHPSVETPSYTVRINGETVELYRTRKKSPSQPVGRDPWMACTIKPLAVVNELLVNAGSVFRVGIIDPGGNDGLAMLFPVSYWLRLLNSEVFTHSTVKFPGVKRLEI